MADLCSPLIATGSGSDLGIAEEVCYGAPLADPQLAVFPRVSTSLTLTKESYQSNQIRADRMVADSRHGIRTAAGDVVTEIAPGVHEMAYEALLGGVWVTPDQIDLATTDLTISAGASGQAQLRRGAGGWLGAGFYFGDTIVVEDTGDAQVDGLNFTITGIVGDTASATFPRGFDTSTLPKALSTGTVRLNGARVRMGNIYRSFVFERAFADIGSFVTFRGNRFNTAGIELPPTGIATTTFGLMGQDADPISGASIDGVSELILTDAELTTLTLDGAARTITAGSGDFATLGVSPGDRVILDGVGITDGQNRNPRTVIEVTGSVLAVAEAIQTGGPYSGPFSVTRVGLPDYLQEPDSEILVAVSGQVFIRDTPVGTVTALSVNVDNGLAGSNVVGSNVVPIVLWGNQSQVTGSLTVLFDRGGAGEEIYNAFDLEEDMTLVVRLDTADKADFFSIILPRIKINAGSIGDAVAEGLPVTSDFVGLKPLRLDAAPSAIIFQDSTIEGVPPIMDSVEPQTLTAAVSHVVGTSTIVLGGGEVTGDGQVRYTFLLDGFAYTYVTDANDNDSESDVATAIAAEINGGVSYITGAATGSSVAVTIPDFPFSGESIAVTGAAAASTDLPTPAVVTTSATGASGSSTEVVITIAGGPDTGASATVDSSLTIDGGSAILSSVPVSAGQGPRSLATALADEINTDSAGALDAVAVAGVVTVSLVSGTAITAGTASVA